MPPPPAPGQVSRPPHQIGLKDRMVMQVDCTTRLICNSPCQGGHACHHIDDENNDNYYEFQMVMVKLVYCNTRLICNRPCQGGADN